MLIAADGTPKITDFGLAKRVDGPIDVELHLHHGHPEQANRPQLTLGFLSQITRRLRRLRVCRGPA